MISREKNICAALRALPFVALLFGSAALADDGRLRFVSGTGVDQGDCLNKFRPCRSLDYVITRAGKADIIRVSEGSYIVDDARSLQRLLAVTGRIEGGFRKISGYSEQTARKDTMLIGVPPEFRERFEQAGFSVIVDRKGIAQDEQQKMRRLTKQILATEKSHTAAPCVSNTSQGYPCQSVGLLSHLSLQDLQSTSLRGNDVWGFTDLNTGREYVFMGLERGVAILDITNPEAPEKIAVVTGSPTTWRDIKVYQRYDSSEKRWRAYAYVTADNVSDFLMVLDLSDLPNGIERVNFNSDFTAAHNAYLVNADYTFGLATTPEGPQLGIAGGRENGGDYRLYALDQPRSPVRSTESTSGYAHDLASFAVGDARKSTQCAVGQSSPFCQVMSDFNENSVDVWDVTNPLSPQLLSSTSYPNASYVHSGWWTEDGQYLLVHDELDEINLGLNTTVRIFDMANLRAPAFASTWVGPTRATDHNGFVKGNRYYISNYSEGLTVLDITNPTSPQRIGYFDTYPSTSDNGFVGAWGVYPFYPSGTIAVGDINTGLYLLRNETLDSPAGSFAFVSTSHSGLEGGAVTLRVARSGGTAGTVSVGLQVLHASTSSEDFTLSTDRLSWAAGDAENKTITLTLNTDAAAEDLELALIQLKAPQGGATVSGADTARVGIADVGSTSRLRLLDSSISVDQARGKAVIAVNRQASSDGEARVTYRTLPNASYAGFSSSQAELTWGDGDTTPREISIALETTALSAGQSGTFQVELTNSLGASLETESGGNASGLIADITVRNTTAAPAPQPQPQPQPQPPSSGNGGGGGGGGSAHLGLLGLLALLVPLSIYRLRKRTAPSAI
jgi:choice-of-anchor B domain-containing protein